MAQAQTQTRANGGFDSLASGSLPAITGNPLQPSWSRSLQELAAANKALISGNPQQPTAAAQVLLGSSRTDFGTLAASLESAPKKGPEETFGSADEIVRKHRDGAIARILQRERELTNRMTEKAVERQLAEDWEVEVSWWMKEIVGTRNLVDSNNTLVKKRNSDQGLSADLQALPGPSTGFPIGNAASTGTEYMDPALVKGHQEVVMSMTESFDTLEVISRFRKIASNHSSGYMTAWDLFASMIPNMSSSINAARGSLVHFCKQYQTIVKNRVAEASLAGQHVSTGGSYGTGLGATIAAYVKLEFGSNASIWHILYFCLRCGDAVAARDIIDTTTFSHDTFPEQPIIRNVVLQMSQRQGNAPCLWQLGTPIVATRDKATIADLYEKVKNLEPNNCHKIGVLALLCGKDLTSFNTIEDYLFGCLWLALQQENQEEQIHVIGKSIRKYGPDHFGGTENGGWGYALPLLAAQQFRTALVYLAEAGGSMGLLQAVHLGMVLSSNGVPLDDLGHSLSEGCLVTALIIKYAHLLEAEPAADVQAALEYILKIPKKDKSRHEIAALICRSHHLVNVLAGILAEDGSRRAGVLDKHLTKAEVSMVLTEAAQMFRAESQDHTKAEISAKLFMLAGRYDAVLTLLNELMSPTETGDDNKAFWLDQCQRFYATYLDKRTSVLASLEEKGQLSLVTTTYALMELRKFFDHIRHERFYDALEGVSALGLIPFSQEDINEKESRYKDVEPILKKQFPALLSEVVRCLHGLHCQVKSESRSMDLNVEARKKELQSKARVVFIFAGLINMPLSTRDDIKNLRNHMI